MKTKIFKLTFYSFIFILWLILVPFIVTEKSNTWYAYSFYINMAFGCFASLKLAGEATNGQMGLKIAIGISPIKIIFIKMLKSSSFILVLNLYALLFSLGFDTKNYVKYLMMFLTTNVVSILFSLMSFTLSGYLKTIYASFILFIFTIIIIFATGINEDIFNWLAFDKVDFLKKYLYNHLILNGASLGLIFCMMFLLRYYRYSRWNNIKPKIKILLQNL